MATVTKLMFDIESKYNGTGLTKARKDLQRFSQQLQQLEKKRVKANVELNVNRNTVDKKIREVEAMKPSVKVELDVDTEAFNTKMRTLRDARATVKLDVDDRAFRDKLAALRGARVTVGLDADEGAFRAQLAAIRGGRVRVHIDADTDSIQERLNNLHASAVVQDLAEAARDRHATIVADADTLRAEIQLANAARDRHATIHVNGNDNNISQTINNVQNNMKRLGMAAKIAAAGVAILMAAFYALGPVLALVGAALTVALPAGFAMMAAMALKENEEVKASFESLGNTFKGIMTEGADSVKDDILGVSNFLQTELVKIAPQLKAAFGAAGDLFLPLTQGVMNLATGALPGMTAAMQKSGPIMDGFKAGMNSLGIGIGSMFNRMTEGAQGLGDTWRVFGDGLGNTLEIIGSGVGKMAEDGAVSLRSLLDALNGFLSGFSDGAAAALSKSAGGFSILGSIFKGLGDFFRNAGPGIGVFTETLGGALGPAIERLLPAFGSFVGNYLQAMAPLMQALSPVILIFAQGLANVMEFAARHPLLLQIMGALMIGAKLAGPLIALVKAIKLLKVAMMALTTANPLLLVITLIIGAIVLLVMNWDKVWPHIKATWERLWNYVKQSAEIIWGALQAAWQFLCNLFTQVWNFFVSLFKPGWDALWNGVKFVAKAVWDFLSAAWNGMVTGIKAIWDFISQAVSTSWNNTWEMIKNVATGIWDFIKGAWDTLLNGVKAIWDTWWAMFSGIWSGAWNWIKDTASGIWNWIKDRWQDLVNNVRAIWDAFWSFFGMIWENAWNWIKDKAEAIWNWIKDRWQNFVNNVQFIWDAFWNFFGKAWENAWNWIKDKAQAIWNWIKDRWTDFTNGVKEILERWRDLVQGIWQRFWDAIKDVAKAVWDKITEGFESFKNGVVGIFESLVDKAKDVWNGIKSIFATPINWVIGVWNDHVADKLGMGDKKINKIEGFADGGRVPGNGNGRADDRLAWVSSGEFVVQERYARNNMPLLTAINGGQTFNQGVGIPKDDNSFKDGGMVGNMEAAHDAARRVGDGRGYVYGGSGPDGFDCSGYMSWIYNALVGEPNLSQRRFSTESDFHALGFKDGLGAGFSIGIHNGGGGPNSHMAGTLTMMDGSGGVNVESGGAANATNYGGPAQGADSFHRTMTFVGDEGGGGLGKFLAGAMGALGSRVIPSIFQTIWEPMTNPILAGIPDPFVPGMGEQMGGLPKGFATKIRDDIGAMIKEKEPKGSSGFVAGGAVPDGDRRRIISEALKLNGMDPNDEAWLRGMNTLIQRESSWNPNSVNTWDSNAEKGTPSKGLAQMIDPTFQAYKIPGRENIMDPVDNVAASINYINKHHGGIGNVQQANANAGPLGYRDGTKDSREGWNLVGENGPEMMKMKGGSEIHSFDDIITRMNGVDPQKRLLEAGTEFGKSTFETAFSDLTGGSVGGVLGAVINDVVPYATGFEENRKKMFEEAQNQQPGNESADPNVSNMQTTSEPSDTTDMEKYDFNKDGQLDDDEKIRAKYMRQRDEVNASSAPEEERQKKARWLSEQITRAEEKITKVGHQGDVNHNYYVNNTSDVVNLQKEQQRLKALGYADV